MVSVRSRKAHRGFTLVELLVVILILAILMAVALPLYLGAIQNSERQTARANMQTIANANQSFRIRNQRYANDINDLITGGDLTTAISGPGTRTYSLIAGGGQCDDGSGGQQPRQIPANGFAVQSSVAGDGCFIPGVSTQ